MPVGPTGGPHGMTPREVATMATDKNVATTTTTPSAVSNPQLMARFHASMLQRATVEDNSDRAADILASQAERIMTAETLEGIMGGDSGGTVQCRDVPNTEWEISGYHVVKSNRTDIENSAGYYISMDAVCLGGPEDVIVKAGIAPGDKVALQTSAALLMVKIRALEAGNFLPMKLLLLGTRTQSGNTVLKWALPPKRVESGRTA